MVYQGLKVHETRKRTPLWNTRQDVCRPPSVMKLSFDKIFVLNDSSSTRMEQKSVNKNVRFIIDFNIKFRYVQNDKIYIDTHVKAESEELFYKSRYFYHINSFCKRQGTRGIQDIFLFDTRICGLVFFHNKFRSLSDPYSIIER